VPAAIDNPGLLRRVAAPVHSLRGGLALNLVTTAASQGLALLSSVVLARLLTLRTFGVLSSLLAASALLVTLGTIGLERAGIVELGRREGAKRRAAAWSLMVVAAIAGVIAAGVASLVTRLVFRGASPAVIVLFGLLVGTEVIRGASFDWLRVWFRHGESALFGQGPRSAVALVIVGVCRLWTGQTTLAMAIGAFALSSLLLESVFVARLARVAGAPRRGDFAIDAVTGAVRNGAPLALANASRSFLNQGDILIVSAAFRPEVVAVYALATKLVNLITSVIMAANSVAMPLLAAGRKHEPSDGDRTTRRERDERVLRTSATVAFGLVLVTAVVLALLGRPLVSSVFGSRYRDAAPLMNILLIGQLVNGASGFGGSLLVFLGRTQLLFWMYSGAAALTAIAEAVAARTGRITLVALVSGLGLGLGEAALALAAKLVGNINVLPEWRIGRLRRMFHLPPVPAPPPAPGSADDREEKLLEYPRAVAPAE
jgi:O-antigen/teichoic acid export membrane protein